MKMHTEPWQYQIVAAQMLNLRSLALGSNPLIPICLIPDQHRLSHPRADQKECQDSHHALLWRRSEDSLRADGKRLVPAVPPLGHL